MTRNEAKDSSRQLRMFPTKAQSRRPMDANPNPGSPEAVDAGCLCSVIDNHYGQGMPYRAGPRRRRVCRGWSGVSGLPMACGGWYHCEPPRAD